jgi:starch synthase (maltosyl-transferring)
MKKQTFQKPYDVIGRNRVIVENITPQVDAGLYPVKRVQGEWLIVEADVFADGHDHVSAILLHRNAGSKKWNEVVMNSLDNDRWQGAFLLDSEGLYEYKIIGFINHPETWIHDFRKRIASGDAKELDVQIKIGIELLKSIQKKYAKSKSATQKWIALLDSDSAIEHAKSSELEQFMQVYPLAEFPTNSLQIFQCVAHRKRAGFSAWYSFFPRSSAPADSLHGTFSDCEKLLPRIKELGFDVVYFPPIHPIGKAFRKGKNNSLDIQPNEPGCPYATGYLEGGHKDVLKELGSLSDFKKFIRAAEKQSMEVAMDFAIQCSPDHPYVKQHPQWFKWRPDGTVQYAENPPKKYQDVLPLDFENDDWQNMWLELKSILEYWIEIGIRIFRIDNPHTKNFLFWEWCIAEINKQYPDVIFLAEAFTRPRIMENLAKKGYHQSYTYFTWRNNKQELMQYMDELTKSPMREYFRPNFWPNTHDINPYILQSGHEPQYIIRFFLAAALSSNYGIFGPCYELMDHAALPGKEEYLDSEKYEVRHWDWTKRNKLTQVMTLVNKARNENVAMQFTNNYSSAHIDNPQMMAWIKAYEQSRIICVVNLDAYNKQSGMVHLPLNELQIHEGQTFVVHDLITGDKYQWSGSANFVELDPYRLPFHLFRVESVS